MSDRGIFNATSASVVGENVFYLSEQHTWQADEVALLRQARTIAKTSEFQSLATKNILE